MMAVREDAGKYISVHMAQLSCNFAHTMLRTSTIILRLIEMHTFLIRVTAWSVIEQADGEMGVVVSQTDWISD
jgi:hypothetical protein